MSKLPSLPVDDALLLLLFPCTTATLCELPAATRTRALTSLREAVSKLPSKTPAATAKIDASVTALLTQAKFKADTPPLVDDELPATLPTHTAAGLPDIAAFIARWGHPGSRDSPHAVSAWPEASSSKPVLVLPSKPRRPQPLDVMPGVTAERETFADYRDDAANPVVSPWSLPVFEWSPRKRCCFIVISFAVVSGTLEMLCTPLAVQDQKVGDSPTPGNMTPCGPRITVRCLFDAMLHKGRTGAVPTELVGRHVTVWDPYVFISARGAHEVQVDSAKDIAFHLTHAEVNGFATRDHQKDGSFALRWLRKAKDDGAALIHDDPAAALRAYTHGLCAVYTRAPLDSDCDCFASLFEPSNIIVKTLENLVDLIEAPAGCLFIAAAMNFFVPTYSPRPYQHLCRAFGGYGGCMNALSGGVPGIPEDRAAWESYPGADVGPRAVLLAAGKNSQNGPPAAALRVIRSFPIVAKVIGNMAMACMKLRMWHHAFTAASIAGLMAPVDLADKYYGRAVVSAMHLRFKISMRTASGRPIHNPDALSQRDEISACIANPNSTCDSDLRPDLPLNTMEPVEGMGRGVFVYKDVTRAAPLSMTTPFASSGSADLRSVQYQDWRDVPDTFAGLFRQLQLRSSMPSASLSQSQLYFLACRDDGVFSAETRPVDGLPQPMLSIAPLLFHDFSLPLKIDAMQSLTGSGRVFDQPERNYGQCLLFDAARAIEAVCVNAHEAALPDGREGALLDLSASLCNHSTFANSVLLPTTVSKVLRMHVVPLRPLKEDEEVTILYRTREQFKRWKFLSPCVDSFAKTLLLSLPNGNEASVRKMVLHEAKTVRRWSTARCAALSKRPLLDFLLDFFGSEHRLPAAVISTLAGWDESVAKVLREDPRLAVQAYMVDTATDHFAERSPT